MPHGAWFKTFGALPENVISLTTITASLTHNQLTDNTCERVRDFSAKKLL